VFAIGLGLRGTGRYGVVRWRSAFEFVVGWSRRAAASGVSVSGWLGRLGAGLVDP